MSVIPLKADIRQREWHVRYVPLTDIRLEYRNKIGYRCFDSPVQETPSLSFKRGQRGPLANGQAYRSRRPSGFVTWLLLAARAPRPSQLFSATIF